MYFWMRFLFGIVVWPFLGKKLFFWFSACNVLKNCGAVTLSASFFPFGVLEWKVFGNCIDS